MTTLKVMTFNTQHCLNYLEQKIDFETMAEAIRREDPDIVGLNEMRGAGENEEYTAQVETLARLTGMPYFHFAPAIEFPHGGPYGNGFLSRIPIERAETVMIPDPEERKYDGYYETRCILKATLAGGITVLCSHFGLNPDELENAARTAAKTVAPEKCILMGDFNMHPENPLLDLIREKMKDTAEKFEGERLSFPSDAPVEKIDYIFVSPDIEVLSADIPATVASDHRPHVAELAL